MNNWVKPAALSKMSDCVDYTISGPPFSCKFSIVDQVTPPIYSRRILIFSCEDGGREQTVLALRSGLQRTINEFPILAGQMGHIPNGWTVQNGKALLRVKNVDMSFSELHATSFSETMLPADVLSSVPTLADPESEWHSCRIQANFIRGGLLLVISINHTTMDGYGITKIIEALARNCHLRDTTSPVNGANLDRSSLYECDSEGDIQNLDAYSIVRGASNLGLTSTPIITKTFQLSPASLKTLKMDASPAESWITTHDAVNALCWRAHVRGRYKTQIISDEDVARFAFPVEFRQLVNPPLSPHYVGNAVLMTQVELPVTKLLGPDGLSLAAVAIRDGVRRVDTSYVNNFIAVAKSLDNPGHLKINLKLEKRNTAFGSTSYKDFAHSTLDWDNVMGKYERLRLASGVMGEGMSIILPVLRDGSWEVTVTVEEGLLELFKNDGELVKYVS